MAGLTGVSRVVLPVVNPQQEQALEYRLVGSQKVAYHGIPLSPVERSYFFAAPLLILATAAAVVVVVVAPEVEAVELVVTVCETNTTVTVLRGSSAQRYAIDFQMNAHVAEGVTVVVMKDEQSDFLSEEGSK